MLKWLKREKPITTPAYVPNEREVCPVCGRNDWIGHPVYAVINPNGEYVKGYGHATVMKQSGMFYQCASCGFREGGNPTTIDPWATQ